MRQFSFYFWTFMLGAVLGVIIETIWCIIKNKKYESRKGVIYGPFNPLYGFATVALTFAINSIEEITLGKVFLTGIVIASVIEYLCSYFQEKITGTVSWNYKNFKFNLNGRINLVYSIIWGFLTVLWYQTFMPMIDSFLRILDGQERLTIVAFIFMVIDCIVSWAARIRRKKRREHIYSHTKIEKHFDYFYNDEVMDRIYPNSEFVDD